jgi:hypothetical protein
MDQHNTIPKSLFMTRVTQGVMLGTVFAVPVALWAYTQANPQRPVSREDVVASTVKAAAKRKPVRKPVRVVDAPTIPASQMHTRIDDGTRQAND